MIRKQRAGTNNNASISRRRSKDDDNNSLSGILDSDEGDDDDHDDDDDDDSSDYTSSNSDSSSDDDDGTVSSSDSDASSAKGIRGNRSIGTNNSRLPTSSAAAAVSQRQVNNSNKVGAYGSGTSASAPGVKDNDEGGGDESTSAYRSRASYDDYDIDIDDSSASTRNTNTNQQPKSRTPKSVLRRLRANDPSMVDLEINLKMVVKLDVAELATEIALSENIKKLTLDCERIPLEDVLMMTKSIEDNESITALAVVNATICRRVANGLASFFARNSTLLGLRLSKCRCVESGLAILFLGLQHSKITTLTIESTNLGGYASDIVAMSVRLSSNLSYIQLTDVNLEQHGMAFLLKNLSFAPLIHLDLSQNKVLSTDEGVDLLVDCMETLSKLQKLKLSDCGFTTVGAMENICDGLSVHRALVDVDLSQNGFGDKGGQLLIKMLSQNHEIKKLNLEGCLVSKKVLKGIVDGVRYNNSFLKNMFSSEFSLAILDSVNMLEDITSSATMTSNTGSPAGKTSTMGVAKK
mmetsp:Transcript_35596/g.86147  ORF Transcript_35596/g.86147 Transcript_35596/m.86147 type:complete len:522 (+) Transcript_35596:116-1681(+)